MLPGVGGFDDEADGVLVETFESTFALKVFEVAADGAFLEEAIELGLIDEAVMEQFLGARGSDRPTFPFGEGLFEELEIGEWFHGADLFGEQLIAEQLIIETAFEVMHSGLEEAFAVETDPEADGSEMSGVGQWCSGEIDFCFPGIEVDVAEDDDAFDGLFEDLRPPAGLGSGVIAFASVKAEFFEGEDEVDEMAAGGAERVMILVGPTEAEFVLAPLLDLGGVVSCLPVLAFALEDDVTGEICADHSNDPVEECMGFEEAGGIVGVGAFACAPEFLGFEQRFHLIRFGVGDAIASVASSFDGFEMGLVFLGDLDEPVVGHGGAGGFRGDMLGGEEVDEVFDAEREAGGKGFGGGASFDEDSGQEGVRMVEGDVIGHALAEGIFDETDFAE